MTRIWAILLLACVVVALGEEVQRASTFVFFIRWGESGCAIGSNVDRALFVCLENLPGKIVQDQLIADVTCREDSSYVKEEFFPNFTRIPYEVVTIPLIVQTNYCEPRCEVEQQAHTLGEQSETNGFWVCGCLSGSF